MTFILQCKRAILMGESVHGSSLSKHRLARYGSWCIHQMRNRDSLHSGNKIIFCVQLQARYDLQTTVDQQGEQSLNKDAITIGGFRWFFADKDAVTKWTMGRADQARNFNFFLQMCNIRGQYNEYKSTRPSQILKSESGKGNVVTVLENECQPVWYCNRQDHVDKL